jgi:hypothetical protein
MQACGPVQTTRVALRSVTRIKTDLAEASRPQSRLQNYLKKGTGRCLGEKHRYRDGCPCGRRYSSETIRWRPVCFAR